MKRYLTFLVSVLSMVTIAGDMKPIKRTMGAWPNDLHNTPFAWQQVGLGKRQHSIVLTSTQVYAVVGGFNAHHTSFAYEAEDGMILGGVKPKHNVSVIWKVAAPRGNKFVGGKATVRGRLLTQNAPEDALELSVGTDVKLVGGGSFWASFKGVALGDAQSVLLKKQPDGTHWAEVSVPKGQEAFYVVATRRVTPKGMSAQFLLQNLQVDYRLDPGKGMEITYPLAEPIWAEGEAISLNIRAAGYQGLDRCWWRVIDFSGNEAGQGAIRVTEGKATLDLAGLDPGFYRVLIHSSAGEKSPAASQDIAILAAQDEKRRKTSIFGVLGYPSRAGVHGSMAEPDDADLRLLKLMGVRWGKESALWAWSQEAPGKPITFGKLEMCKKLKNAGFDVIVTCGTTPKWANGNTRPSALPTPEHHKSWFEFNKHVAQVSRGTVTWFQSWNEPNNPNTLWEPKWNMQRRAVRAKTIQQIQYKGLKAGNPDAKLIGGCFAGVPAKWFDMWLSEPSSTLNYQDGMSGHLYCKVSRETNWAHNRPPEPNIVPRIMAARDVMDERGAARSPIFLTEYGWFTPKTSLADSARWVARQNIIVKAYQEKTKTRAHLLFSPGDIKNGHNVLRFNPDILPGQHRLMPVIGSYALSSSLLANAKPLAAISDHPKPVRCYSFKQGYKTIYAAWVTEETNTGEITIPVKEARQALEISVMGHRKIVRLTPGTAMKLPDNHDPVYWVVSDEVTPVVQPRRLHFSVSDTDGDPTGTIQFANIGPGVMKVVPSSDQPWIKVAQQADRLVVSITKNLLIPGDHRGHVTLETGNGSIQVPINVARFKSGKCSPVAWSESTVKAEAAAALTEYEKRKNLRSKQMKKGTRATMISRLCAGVALATVMAAAPTRAEAQQADGLKNLTRAKSVTYAYLDKEGNPLDAAKFKDPKQTNLRDGKRTDASIARAEWAANKAKEMRIRFDFGQEVSPKRLTVVWMLWKSKKHWIDRIKVLVGNSPSGLKEVKSADVEWAPKRGFPIQIKLPDCKGRYLELVIEQDADPAHMMFAISEVEIFGSAEDRAKLDK